MDESQPGSPVAAGRFGGRRRGQRVELGSVSLVGGARQRYIGRDAGAQHLGDVLNFSRQRSCLLQLTGPHERAAKVAEGKRKHTQRAGLSG